MFSFNPAALKNVPLPPVVGEPGLLTAEADAFMPNLLKFQETWATQRFWDLTSKSYTKNSERLPHTPFSSTWVTYWFAHKSIFPFSLQTISQISLTLFYDWFKQWEVLAVTGGEKKMPKYPYFPHPHTVPLGFRRTLSFHLCLKGGVGGSSPHPSSHLEASSCQKAS